MIEFSVFVGETKKASIVAGSALEAIAIYAKRIGTDRHVWAMHGKVL